MAGALLMVPGVLWLAAAGTLAHAHVVTLVRGSARFVSWGGHRAVLAAQREVGNPDRTSLSLLHWKVLSISKSHWPPPGQMQGASRAGHEEGGVWGPQDRVILSGGMNPVSPRVLSATRPLGRMTRWVMLPLLRERRSQPSGGNCRALHTM